jgi:hypothetical protein
MALQIQFSDKQVSPWGGLILMKEILDKTGVSKKLSELNLPQSTSNNSIDRVSIVESFFASVWIGATAFSQTAIIKLDSTVKEIFGWSRVPSGTTFGRFFKKFSWKENNRIFTQLNQWFFKEIKFDNYTLDVDSSVITRYGSQEGSLKGYNPKKSGRSSHHPLFAFISELRMVANCWLRSGNTASASNCLEFLKETFRILRDKTIGLFRADSGFASNSIFEYLEKEQIPYVIAGRMHAVIQQKIKDIKNWLAIGEGLWIAEIEYKAERWSKARRVVVVKQDIQMRPKATGKKLKLFNDDLYYQNQRYHSFITNQMLPSKQIWEQYKERADAENRIQELKYDFGLEGFNMKEFFATEAAMRFITVAYNLMSLYKHVTTQTSVQQRLHTIRINCFAVGGWIVKQGNKKILKLAVRKEKRPWMEGLLKIVRDVGMPLSLKT